MPKLVDQFGSPISSLDLADQLYVKVAAGGDGRSPLQLVYDLFSNNVFGFDVQSIIRNPRNGLYFFTDFIENHTSQMILYANGTGASVQKGGYGQNATTKAIGVLQADTGTTAFGNLRHLLSGANVIPNKLGKGLFICRIAIEQLSTSAEEFNVICGWEDYNTHVFGPAVWRYYRPTDGNFWTCISGVSPTTTKTVTVIPVTTDYIWLATVINADWTEVKFYYSNNGTSWTLAATHTTNIPQSSSAGVGYGINKSVGTTQSNISIDLLMFAYLFNR